jgi:hypothetical protein
MRRGKCEITATAAGRKALYEGFTAKLLTAAK